MVSLISSSLVFFFTGVEVFSFSLSSLGKDTSSDLSGDKPRSVSTLGGVAHVYTHMGMYRGQISQDGYYAKKWSLFLKVWTLIVVTFKRVGSKIK